MHTGKIKRLIKDRGFGFISDTDGNEVFFHKNSLIDAQFDTLTENQAVEFETKKTPKGSNAINIRLSA